MGLYLVGGMLHSGKKSSIFVTGSYSFMTVHMQDLLTTNEAATYLRLSERKLYELVANGAVPCTKVTGKWLFPKAALDRWAGGGSAHACTRPCAGAADRRRQPRSAPGMGTARERLGACQPAGRQRGGIAAARTRRGRRGRDSPAPTRRR